MFGEIFYTIGAFLTFQGRKATFLWREQASTFTAMAVHTGRYDAALPAHPSPWRVVKHQPRGVPGCHVVVVPWHVAGVCVMYATLSGGVCHVLFGSNHHMTADKALPSAHVQRNGARAECAGSAAWCVSCVVNTNNSGGDSRQCCSMSIQVRRGARAGKKMAVRPYRGNK